MNTSKKILSIILAVMMILSIIPITASAETTSGTCGENLIWSYNTSTYTLTISGTGAMYDYGWTNRPWESYENDVMTININDGVTTIGMCAFNNCDSLTSVTIPDSVTAIGNAAFFSCDSLTSVTIGDSVTTIGDDAFADCDSLTSVTIPDSVTAIGNDAFFSCDSLTSVTVDSYNQYYSSDEDGVLFNKDKTTLLEYPAGNTRTSYTIPDSVTTIGYSAFSSCGSLTNVTIPDSVTTIDSHAFYYCNSLTRITIPDSVTTIGNSAFRDCWSLTSVTIPDSVTTIGEWAFENCDSLTSVTIGNSVQTISERAFYDCDNLTNVTIGNSVQTIGEYAFYDCDNLTNVTIGNSVQTIGEYAFYDCDNLTSVTIPDSVTKINDCAFYGCNNLTSVTIGNSVQTIGEHAFRNCYSLTSITIPDSVITIGFNAFLDSAYYNDTSNWENDVLYIGKHLISSKDSISTNYEIKEGTLTIGNSAFNSRERLTSITIPDSVTKINDFAFYNCGLSNVYYGGTEEEWNNISIGYMNNLYYGVTVHYSIKGQCGDNLTWRLNKTTGIFKISGTGAMGDYSDIRPWEDYLDDIETVIICDGVTTIGDYAFYNCDSLTSVTIPDSVTTIGNYAFYGCDSLTDVYFSGTKAQLSGISIGSYNSDLISATIHHNNCNGIYETVVISPICTEKGYTTYTCECGNNYVSDYVDALGHTPANSVEENYIAPTCTENGSKDLVVYCLECDEEIIRETLTIDATGHNYASEITTPATHLTEGVETFLCNNCCDSYTKTIAKTTEHTYTSVVISPTCTEQGYTTYTCECGDSYVADYVDENGHDYKATVTKPTCTEKGYTTNVCSSCGDGYIDNYKGATGHDYDNGIVTTKPTCTKAGIMIFTCANCGDTYTEYVDATGHSYISEITRPATHLTTGVETFTCNNCADSYTKTIAKTTEHTYNTVVTTPTCTAKGYTTYICECGSTYKSDYTNATGHSYTSEITISATHLTTGVETFTCHCGNSYTKTIAKTTEHTYNTVVTPPTCTAQGYTIYTCACGDAYKSNYTSVTPHTLAWQTLSVASCNTNGVMYGYCEDCSYFEVQTTPLTGHADNDGDGKCDVCAKVLCNHSCHKGGISGFFWKITLFFSRLFGSNKFCECGIAHY